jgi:hypothetical protein
MTRKTPQDGARRVRKATSVQPPALPVDFQAGGNGGSFSMEEEIRRRAYEIYLERGCTPGNENEDWLVAEREVRSRQVQQSA